MKWGKFCSRQLRMVDEMIYLIGLKNEVTSVASVLKAKEGIEKVQEKS